jgi:hypothetical protein
MEPIEDQPTLVDRDAGSGVVDLQPDTVASCCLNLHFHPAPGSRVFAGVIDQNTGKPIDPIRWSLDHERTLANLGETERDLASLGQGPKSIGARGGNCRNIRTVVDRSNIVFAVGACQPQQIVDDSSEAPPLSGHPL